MTTNERRSTMLRAIIFLVTALPVMVVCLFPLVRTGPVFNTPDETSNYITAREFGQTGKLYLENELTEVDQENLLHTRGFINHQGRAVPMQFLGHPLFWGCSFKLLGARAWLIVCPALGLFFTFYLYRLFRLVAPSASAPAFLFLFSASPLIYLLGRPFLSASLALVFTVPVFDHAIRYSRTRSTRQLILLSVFLSLTLLARPDNIPLALPALYLVISHAAGGLFNRGVLRDALIFSLVFAVLFAIPVLALNTMTYGSPTTFGYQLVDQTIGLRETPAGELDGAARLLRTARNLVLPFDVSLTGALAGLLRYFIILTPLLTLAALARTGDLVRSLRTPGRRVVTAMALALAAYLVISRASSGLHGMGRLLPDILDSLARYWMPLYLVLLVAGWKTISRWKSPAWQTATALLALVLGTYGLFLQWDQSYLKMTRQVRFNSGAWRRIMVSTEPDAVIYSGRNDKYMVPHRFVASWWETQGGSCYDPQLLARSADRILDLGRTAYLADPTVDTNELRPILAEHGMELRFTRFRRNLFAIARQDPPS